MWCAAGTPIIAWQAAQVEVKVTFDDDESNTETLTSAASAILFVDSIGDAFYATLPTRRLERRADFGRKLSQTRDETT